MTALESGTQPQAFRWRLDGDLGPGLASSLHLGEAVRNAVFRTCKNTGPWPWPTQLHRGRGHTHAFWLPEDEDGDGLVDHVLLFAETGLPANLLPALATGGKVYLDQRSEWQLAPEWMGRRGVGGLFGPARLWVTQAPYVTPFRASLAKGTDRAGSEPGEQLRQELAMRKHPIPPPKPTHVEFESVELSAIATRRLAARKGPRADLVAPPRASAHMVSIEFPEPVWGPLALGFGAHFGLGLFVPAE